MNYTFPVSYAPITAPRTAYTISVSEHIQCSIANASLEILKLGPVSKDYLAHIIYIRITI